MYSCAWRCEAVWLLYISGLQLHIPCKLLSVKVVRCKVVLFLFIYLACGLQICNSIIQLWHNSLVDFIIIIIIPCKVERYKVVWLMRLQTRH